MPFHLDDYDVRILRALLRDGRKSFREISRETGITTPTVKARFNRLVNVGFIKSIEEGHKHDNQAVQHLQTANSRIKKGMKIRLDCEFSQGPILGDPYVFKS